MNPLCIILGHDHFCSTNKPYGKCPRKWCKKYTPCYPEKRNWAKSLRIINRRIRNWWYMKNLWQK